MRYSILRWTICFVGALPITARANESSPVMVVFSRSGSNNPYYSTWNGAAWIAAAAMPTVSSPPNYIVTANCPTRNETACLTVGQDQSLHVLFHNGGSWSSATQICSDVDTNSTLPCAMAYESLSGNLIIAYWIRSSRTIGWRTYNGVSLSTESSMTLSGINRLTYLSLVANPCTNEAILSFLAANKVLLTSVWNGSYWSVASPRDNNLIWYTPPCYATAYIGVSSLAMTAYTITNSWNPQYQLWNGASWSAAVSAPAFNSTPYWVRLIGDSKSNSLLYGSLYYWKSGNITVNQWNGTSWGSPLAVDTSVTGYDTRLFDLAWEPGGANGLVVYQKAAETQLRYRTFNGTSWSSEHTGTDIGSAARFVQLRQGVATGEIFIAVSDGGDDLELMRWNGSTMSASTQIEGNLGGTSTTEPFMISVPATTATNCQKKIIKWREVPRRP